MQHRKPNIRPDDRSPGAPDPEDDRTGEGSEAPEQEPAITPTWVVVADNARARIFTLDGDGSALREEKEILHPQSRAHERDLRSDRPGKAFDILGPGRHALIKEVSHKETEAQRLSIQLAHEIEVARARSDFKRLIIVAPPSFLGDLRARLSSTTTRMIVAEVDKELVNMTPNRIADHLPPDLVPRRRETTGTRRTFPLRPRPVKRKRMESFAGSR